MRRILGVRPQATNLGTSLKSRDGEAIFAQMLQHRKPAGPCSAHVSVACPYIVQQIEGLPAPTTATVPFAIVRDTKDMSFPTLNGQGHRGGFACT